MSNLLKNSLEMALQEIDRKLQDAAADQVDALLERRQHLKDQLTALASGRSEREVTSAIAVATGDWITDIRSICLSHEFDPKKDFLVVLMDRGNDTGYMNVHVEGQGAGLTAIIADTVKHHPHLAEAILDGIMQYYTSTEGKPMLMQFIMSKFKDFL